MTPELDLFAQSYIIPYTLVPSSDDENEVMQTVRSFVSNLTISKYWNRESLNCDFKGILSSIEKIKNPKLCAVALRFLNEKTGKMISPILKLADFSHVRKIDIERAIELGEDFKTLGRYPLAESCNGNRGDLALLFLKKGFDPTIANNYPIRWASENGHAEVVRFILDDEAKVLSDETNLMKSARESGHHRLANFLSLRRMEYNSKDSSLTELACQGGHAEVVRLFLDRGVDPGLKNNYFIRVSSEKCHHEVVKLLIERGADPTIESNCLIKEASEKGFTELVKVLLAHRAVDPSAEDNYALRKASENGHVEVVRLLLSCPKVDPTVCDYYPIKFAAFKGHLEVVKLLLEHEGANPSGEKNNVKASGLKQALEAAVCRGRSEVVRIVLDYGADPSASDNHAIKFASQRGHAEVVSILLDHPGVDPSVDNHYPIRAASIYGRVEVVRVLLGKTPIKGVRLAFKENIRNNEIKTLLSDHIQNNSSNICVAI